jgi:hypothetical protein
MKASNYPSLELAAARSKDLELDLHKRALAGDPKAKAEVEAKALRIDVDNATAALFDRARSGDRAAISAMRQIANGKAPTTTSSAAPATVEISRRDVERAEAVAVARERRRMAEVYASPHSRGRERGCATLLTADKGWSAAEIVKELPHLPMDAKRATAANRASSDAVWERANASRGNDASRASANGTAARRENSDPWSRAYASVSRNGSSSTGAAK